MRVRQAIIEDLDNGLLDLWQVLADVSKLNKYEAEIAFLNCTGNIFVVTSSDDTDILATATLIIDKKVRSSGGRGARLEEVVVREDMRGTGIGKMLVQHLIEEARRLRCYKIMLCCNDKNVRFYEACGMRKHDNTMRIDL